jgi:hypothetical protein
VDLPGKALHPDDRRNLRAEVREAENVWSPFLTIPSIAFTADDRVRKPQVGLGGTESKLVSVASCVEGKLGTDLTLIELEPLAWSGSSRPLHGGAPDVWRDGRRGADGLQ